jgi:hypothetical protein
VCLIELVFVFCAHCFDEARVLVVPQILMLASLRISEHDSSNTSTLFIHAITVIAIAATIAAAATITAVTNSVVYQQSTNYCTASALLLLLLLLIVVAAHATGSSVYQ